MIRDRSDVLVKQGCNTFPLSGNNAYPINQPINYFKEEYIQIQHVLTMNLIPWSSLNSLSKMRYFDIYWRASDTHTDAGCRMT